MVLVSAGSADLGSSENKAAACASMSAGTGGGSACAGAGGGFGADAVGAALGMVTIFLQPGQAPRLPANWSLNTKPRLQCGQVNLIGMIGGVRDPVRRSVM